MNMIAPARSYYAGMGDAVADRTVNRRIFTNAQHAAIGSKLWLNPEDPDFNAWDNAAKLSGVEVVLDDKTEFVGFAPDLRTEEWADVAHRVAEGSVSLTDDTLGLNGAEFTKMRDHLRKAALLMSGRHLQHGDKSQKIRPLEVFTNCSSAAANFLLFYLLLNGSGVGRAYDDVMMKVDYSEMPRVFAVIDKDYPDRSKMIMEWSEAEQKMISVPMIGDHFMTPAAVADLLEVEEEYTTYFRVPDSRGGWAKALEKIEMMTYEGRSDENLVLIFCAVRQNGSPIRGMQNRPSSGPGPLMNAIYKISQLRGTDMKAWESTMFADHYAAECVLVGGARRAARMATKSCWDETIFDFISIKKRHNLWSSNNSVTVDQEFRDACAHVRDLIKTTGSTITNLFVDGKITKREMHAWNVLYALASAAYHDGTGEPGIISQDKLNAVSEGLEIFTKGNFVGSKDFQIEPETEGLMTDLARTVSMCSYFMITNPCGEIALLMLGAYCVIADVVPFHSDSDDDAEDAFRTAVRALMRTNTMDSLYSKEVARTNRIGVGITGFHEWAYSRFKFIWSDIIDEAKSLEMWLMLSRFRRAISAEAETYAKVLGVTVPHTNTCFKPAGTTSKLFGLTEGAHLPSMRWFMRWVQFRNDDPLIENYRAKGYPVRELKSYSGTTIVGFPTAPTICSMDGGDWVVTAAEATPEEQYQFLRLLEKYWIVGVEEDGSMIQDDRGNQISYTLKYDPEKVSFLDFLETLIDGQFSIRCCSVMPQTDVTAYEYQPEEPITRLQYETFMANIKSGGREEVDFVHVDCGSGACPVDFSERVA